MDRISVVLADDNLIVREGVRSLLVASGDTDVVGVAGSYQELVDVATEMRPQVVVTDIRMPPSFNREGIEAAKEIRKLNPGTGVVVLSQFDRPEYAIALLADGASGYAYLLKEHVADSDQLIRAVREVAVGGSVLDPRIVEMLVQPASPGVGESGQELLRLLAGGRSLKAIAVARGSSTDEVNAELDRVLSGMATKDSDGTARLRELYRALLDRDQQLDTLSRLVPSGLAEELRRGSAIGQVRKELVSVLVADVRGFTTIAEKADPAVLAGQLSQHRDAVSDAIHRCKGIVMQFTGDSVMGVFSGDVGSGHADRAVHAAGTLHAAQATLNASWEPVGLPAFGLGIGICTGEVATALLGSGERLEYTVVGDTANLAERLQALAAPGETIVSQATYAALSSALPASRMEPRLVKGRMAPVVAFRLGAEGVTAAAPGHAGLSGRELEIVLLVAQGLTDREVAQHLSLSVRTVGKHLEHVRDKLGLRSRTEVTAWAATTGLLADLSDT